MAAAADKSLPFASPQTALGMGWPPITPTCGVTASAASSFSAGAPEAAAASSSSMVAQVKTADSKRSSFITNLSLRTSQLGGASGVRAGRSGGTAAARRASGVHGALVERALGEVRSAEQILHVKYRLLGPTPPTASALRSALADTELNHRVLCLRRVLQMAPLVVIRCEDDDGDGLGIEDEREGGVRQASSALRSPLARSVYPPLTQAATTSGGGQQFGDEASPWDAVLSGREVVGNLGGGGSGGGSGVADRGGSGEGGGRRSEIQVVISRPKYERACAGQQGQVGARFVVFPPWVEHPVKQSDGSTLLTIMATHVEALPFGV